MSNLVPTARSLEETTGGVDFASFGNLELDNSKRFEREQKLDDVISGAVDRVEARDGTLSDPDVIFEHEAKLKRRYGAEATLGTVVDSASDWLKYFRADPFRAEADFKSNFTRHSTSVFEREDDPAPTSPAKNDEDVHTNIKLSQIIDAAIDHNERKPLIEQSASGFEAHRSKLDELFPGRPLKDQLEAFENLMVSTRRDPAGTAARLAAMAGAPVTALDLQRLEAHVQGQQTEVTIAQNLQVMQDHGELLHMDDPMVCQDMITLLSHPEFPRTGNDYRDAWEANRAAVDHAIRRRTEAEQQRAADVEKAQRAAPIKTSNSMKRASQADDTRGLDAVLNSALASW